MRWEGPHLGEGLGGETERGGMGKGQECWSQECSCHRRIRVEGAVMSEQRLGTHGSAGTFCPEPLGGRATQGLCCLDAHIAARAVLGLTEDRVPKQT